MLARMCELVRRATGDARIVAPSAKYGEHHAAIVLDRWPGEGPLGGIVTALEDAKRCDSSSEHCLVISCDMPFLTSEWLAYLCERTLASEAQVLAPQSAHGIEPLCACWRVDAASVLRGAFEEGVRRVTEGMKRLHLEVLDEKDWARFDSAGRLFWNMNTPQDYQNALAALAEERA